MPKILIEVEYDEAEVLEKYVDTPQEGDPWADVGLAIEARIESVLGEGCKDVSVSWED